jgi:hypothetical protein
VADGARVELDDAIHARITGGQAAVDRAPCDEHYVPSWPPQAPIDRPHSSDETRTANSSHPNTTGYQFRREFGMTEGSAPGTRGCPAAGRSDQRRFVARSSSAISSDSGRGREVSVSWPARRRIELTARTGPAARTCCRICFPRVADHLGWPGRLEPEALWVLAGLIRPGSRTGGRAHRGYSPIKGRAGTKLHTPSTGPRWSRLGTASAASGRSCRPRRPGNRQCRR